MSIADELRGKLLRDGDYLLAEECDRQAILTVAKTPSVNINVETQKVELNGKAWIVVRRVDNDQEAIEINEQTKYLIRE